MNVCMSTYLDTSVFTPHMLRLYFCITGWAICSLYVCIICCGPACVHVSGGGGRRGQFWPSAAPTVHYKQLITRVFNQGELASSGG